MKPEEMKFQKPDSKWSRFIKSMMKLLLCIFFSPECVITLKQLTVTYKAKNTRKDNSQLSGEA